MGDSVECICSNSAQRASGEFVIKNMNEIIRKILMIEDTTKKIYIDTMGCPKNHVDSEMLAGMLLRKGQTLIDNPDEADCIIINTCGFINDAKIESIDRIFEMAQYDKELVVTGCLTQRYADDLYEEIPEIDIIAGVNDYVELPNIISRFPSRCPSLNASGDQENNKSKNQRNRVKLANEYSKKLDIYNDEYMEYEIWKDRINVDKPWSRTIKISEGCDNRCAFCVIPNIRGNYRSRKPINILTEAKYMASQGVKELIIIGQDTTNYGSDFCGEEINTLAKLLKALCKIDGLEWIRLMYCYEDKVTDELIEVLATENKICKYIDMPLQHIADPVLSGMKRRSSTASTKETLKKLREKIDDLHIRTTFIVGFPGENEYDFDELYDFVTEEKFERLGVFTYSMEDGTIAGEMENQIDEEIKEARMNSIMNLQIENSRERNEGKIGKVMEVLIEEEDEEALTYIGRTRFDAPEIDNGVIVRSNKELKLGEFVFVQIEDAFDYDIVGTVVERTK